MRTSEEVTVAVPESEGPASGGLPVRRQFLLIWCGLLFLACFGLGYPTLNRYDPRTNRGLTDSIQYYNLVEKGPASASGHWKYRVLVPYLAKPIYLAARGRFGSWHPTALALLVVNAGFCAATAALLSLLAYEFSGNAAIAMLAAFAYLLNFSVANYHLSGLVESGDAFWFLVLAWALLRERWFLLPVIGVLGGVTKETFVPIACVFAAAWMFFQRPKKMSGAVLGLVLMAAGGMIAVLGVRSLIDQRMVMPWNIVEQERNLSKGTAHNFLSIVTSWNMWLTFVWAPFLALAAKRIPRGWLYGALAAALVTVALATWNNSEANTSRPLFNVLGPVIALSFALWVDGVQRRGCNGTISFR